MQVQSNWPTASYAKVATNRYRPVLRRRDGSTSRIGKRNYYSPEAAREAAQAYLDQRARDLGVIA
ncbi:hypothetical protein [Mycobacterium phage Kashi_VT1]|nr:hypothetical protein [Mycobacterium phage Kashi_VT1]